MKSQRITEIFLTFLRLGCRSFGGPVAHLAYYREELVRRRQWISEPLFAEIVAFCQMMPGPGSSQAGFTIGLAVGGWRGALAAWTGFTAPSAILMIAFGLSQASLSGAAAQRAIHGLQLFAVAIVTQAVLGLRKRLAPDVVRMLIAAGAASFVLTINRPGNQFAAILASGIVGYIVLRRPDPADSGVLEIAISKRVGVAALTAFGLLAVILRGFLGDIYRTAALVFGGGPVVLPLLESVTVAKGLMDQRTFLAGYGAAQALPGPLFSFSAFLGTAQRQHPNGIAGGLLALFVMFTPGMLLVLGVMPFWMALREKVWLRSALGGVNAGVVGILAAALYRPVWTVSVHTITDVVVVICAFAVLTLVNAPSWSVALITTLASVLIFR